MLRREKDGLVYLAFKTLEAFPELRHAVFTKRGPGGRPFNLSPAKGDPAEALANISLAARALGIAEPSFVNQVHGDEILSLAPGETSRPAVVGGKEGRDALVGRPGLGLLIKLADCQGIILYHPGTKTPALIHSGWRGSVLNIAGKTVDFLRRERGIPPRELFAGVSPSIGPCCMEFKDWRTLIPEGLRRFKREGGFMDFWAMTVFQLTEAGVPPENIELSGLCTRCDDEFFSHRKGDALRFGVMCGVLT
ncbi:MAG: polyphenol oxidase family protein [Deltaproteobacteria bacterium]|nr:polyphenol oxidase family protein [Deltaproteobacteria bacterium]